MKGLVILPKKFEKQWDKCYAECCFKESFVCPKKECELKKYLDSKKVVAKPA